jgi:DNA-binding NarL/FixJ family response regulator
MIRVLLIDDQDLIRAGLTMLCKAAPDLDVVGEGRSGAEALRLAADLRPDVILMDLRMPVMDGITATRLIRQASPRARIVALTTFDDDDHLYPALAAGACGFLTKDAAPAQLLDGIRRAAAGENPYSAEVLARLVNRAVATHTPPTATEPAPRMTPREREVLALVGTGLSNQDIANRMNIGITTVKTHVARLMDRTGSPNRVHLALLAIKHQITP